MCRTWGFDPNGRESAYPKEAEGVGEGVEHTCFLLVVKRDTAPIGRGPCWRVWLLVGRVTGGVERAVKALAGHQA
jgi:hypothetical protein